MFLLGDKTKNLPTEFKNPFNSQKIEAVRMHIYPKDNDIRATIEFKNGNTKGEQSFRGSDFNEIMRRMQAFVNSL